MISDAKAHNCVVSSIQEKTHSCVTDLQLEEKEEEEEEEEGWLHQTHMDHV